MNKEQLEQNIKNMEAELAKMKEELNKPEKFEFKYDYNCQFIKTSHITKGTGSFHESLNHYRYRISENNAEAELLRNKQGNFIGALFEQIDVNYAKGINWEEDNQNKYYIYFHHGDKKWGLLSISYVEDPSVVYTSKLEVAEKAVELLNSGQVEYPKQ